MLGILIVWIINLFRALGNLWRRILRRRVDYVRIEIAGALPEFTPSPRWWQRRFLGMSAPLSLYELRRQLARIAADQQALGVLLRINGLAAGWATLQSLRDEIGHFRACGKRVVAYTAGRTPHPWTVYVAVAVHADLEQAVLALGD